MWFPPCDRQTAGFHLLLCLYATDRQRAFTCCFVCMRQTCERNVSTPCERAFFSFFLFHPKCTEHAVKREAERGGRGRRRGGDALTTSSSSSSSMGGRGEEQERGREEPDRALSKKPNGSSAAKVSCRSQHRPVARHRRGPRRCLGVQRRQCPCTAREGLDTEQDISVRRGRGRSDPRIGHQHLLGRVFE
jgi:hypothetical protein